jgi:hypothetical protein
MSFTTTLKYGMSTTRNKKKGLKRIKDEAKERREKRENWKKKKEFWCDFELNWTPLFKGGFRN